MSVNYEGHNHSLLIPILKAKAEEMKEKNKIGELFGLICAASLHSVNFSVGFNKA